MMLLSNKGFSDSGLRSHSVTIRNADREVLCRRYFDNAWDAFEVWKTARLDEGCTIERRNDGYLMALRRADDSDMADLLSVLESNATKEEKVNAIKDARDRGIIDSDKGIDLVIEYC